MATGCREKGWVISPGVFPREFLCSTPSSFKNSCPPFVSQLVATSSHWYRTARFSVPSRERKTDRNTESNQKNKIVSSVLKASVGEKKEFPTFLVPWPGLLFLVGFMQKSWRHSAWRPSLSCSLTTNWFHVFSGCKVFLKTRAAEKTCNRICVCVHLYCKLASPHVAAIFRSQSSLAELVYGLSGC